MADDSPVKDHWDLVTKCKEIRNGVCRSTHIYKTRDSDEWKEMEILLQSYEKCMDAEEHGD